MYCSLCVAFLLLFHIQCEALVIDSVDFPIDQFRDHHTDKFYAIENNESNVIVRRGAELSFKINFVEANNNDRIFVKLSFATNRDEMRVYVPSFLQVRWRLKQSRKAQSIDCILHIPGNAPVGAWKMGLIVISRNGTIIEKYHVPQEIVVLFNAWSKEDAAYFNEEYKLEEYVLGESGTLYLKKGKADNHMKWIFGQFESQVLAAILFILDSSGLTAKERGNIVNVTRSLTHLLNYYSEYHSGVLVGKWKPPYDKGFFGQKTFDPMSWTGSAPILRQYYRTYGLPVGFGQCWVYAGLLTTVLRSLGIASRPVANFASAHDNGHDLTMDTYLDKTGKTNHSASDSVWNFHQWVQAWFRRYDLGLTYGEWQQLDATPQAINDGKLQVGPASGSLILKSHLRNKYEMEYLYAEVNADEVIWTHDMKILKTRNNGVGLYVLTKAFNKDAPEDITHLFKPKEDTREERESYRKAAESLGITPPSLRIEIVPRSQKSEKISFFITSPNDVAVGSPINIEISIHSKYSQEKEVNVILEASTIYYNGKINALIKNETRRITVPALQLTKVLFSIQSKDYIGLLTSMRTISIEAVMVIEKKIYRVEERIFLNTPKLLILAPKAINYNSQFKVIVKFKNPLNQTLSNCRISTEGMGMKRKVVKLSDVPAFATEKITLKLSSKHYGQETIVITLHNDLLKEIVGHVQVQVLGQERNKIVMYPKNNKGLPSAIHSAEILTA